VEGLWVIGDVPSRGIVGSQPLPLSLFCSLAMRWVSFALPYDITMMCLSYHKLMGPTN
jgi:hypothetical protein